MTNQEKRQRRREAALKGARTRAATAGRDPEPAPPPEPPALTARQLLERAQSIGREEDLYYHAHIGRFPHRPSAWTAEQRAALNRFLGGFIRPDGTPQPVPHRKKRTR